MQVFLTPQYLAIAMEFVPGIDLFKYTQDRGRLRESAARYGQLLTLGHGAQTAGR